MSDEVNHQASLNPADSPEQATIKKRLVQLLDYVAHQANSQKKPFYAVAGTRYYLGDLLVDAGVDLLDEGFTIERQPLPEDFVISPDVAPYADIDIHQGVRINFAALNGLISFQPYTGQRKPGYVAEGVLESYIAALGICTRICAEHMRWMRWKSINAATLQSIRLYDQFFNWGNAQAMGGLPDGGQVVMGLGMLHWKLPSGVEYAYPVFTQPLEISIDPTGLIFVSFADDLPHLEMEGLLAESEIPHAGKVKDYVATMLATQEHLNFLDPETYRPLVQSLVSMIHSRGAMVDSVNQLPFDGDPVASLESFIFVRPHTSNVLRDDVQALKARLDDDNCQITGHLNTLVSELSDQPPAKENVVYRGCSGVIGKGEEVKELYFPLPYNIEQVSIARNLDAQDGVLVQGPPGTGKTHTIANLVSHYLAQGLKVLITAQQPHVLKTLHEKLPKQIRALAISRIGSSQESKRLLDANIEHIVEKLSHLNEFEVQKAVDDLAERIDATHVRMADIDQQLNLIAQEHYGLLTGHGRPMSPDECLRFIYSGHQEFEWFEDRNIVAEFPLNTPLLNALHEARSMIGGLLPRFAVGELPDDGVLFTPDEIHRISEVNRDLQRLDQAITTSVCHKLPGVNEQDFADFIQDLEICVELLNQVAHDRESVLYQVIDSLKNPHLSLKILLELVISEEVQELLHYRNDLLVKPITLDESVTIHSPVYQAILRGVETGRPYAWYHLDRRGGATLQTALVAGQKPMTAQDWLAIATYVEMRDKCRALVVKWNNVAAELGYGAIEPAANLYRHLETIAQVVFQFEKAIRLYSEVIESVILRCTRFFKGQFADDHIITTIKDIAAYWDKCKEQDQLLAEFSEFQCKRDALSMHKFYLSDGLMEKLNQVQLGNLNVATVSAILEHLRKIGQLQELREQYALVKECSQYFAEAGAVLLAQRLLVEPNDDLLGDPVLRGDLLDAWTWRNLSDRFDQITSLDLLERLMADRKACEKALSKDYENLVSQQTWLRLKQAASEKTLVALNRYRISVQKIGKGKGKNAPRYRKDAQEALQQITQTIPCWIMSHQQVSETMPAELEMFDLVIVDEASQSSIDAIPVLMRGKKLLVVGDNKQVSPSNVGLSVEQITTVREKYLAEQPHKQYLTPDMSLYDMTAAIYGSSVMLLEHFRCHPEIIAYSNDTFYAGRIKPMRVPTQAEQIGPVLIHLPVPGGERTSKGNKFINHQEAEVIVGEVGRIMSAPHYRGRTIGVISLLGQAQADYIQEMALTRYGAEALVMVKFACGEASAFQGAERDIIFLSMVADPDNCTALSSLAHEQRFNVAASRARDRMYLVASVSIDRVSAKDLRKGLLQFFLSRKEPGRIGTIQAMSMLKTPFEKEVYMELISRGYQVHPHYPVGKYSLDLMVDSGTDKRLAIECEGDISVEEWKTSVQKQRDLERAGWTFWRCFYLSWLNDREQAMRSLIGTLHHMGIHPAPKSKPTEKISPVKVRGVAPYNPALVLRLIQAGINPGSNPMMGFHQRIERVSQFKPFPDLNNRS